MQGRVTSLVEDGIARVTLSRAHKRNALDRAMFEALVTAGEKIGGDPSVRAVVLSGEGRAFCAGLDLDLFSDQGAIGSLVERTHGIANRFQYAAWVWRELPVPVIAAVHGTCYGGGLQLMLGADVRYVHPESRLSIMEVRWGLVPDMAGTQLWGDLVRGDVLRELTYTGRIFSGEEALSYGFATRVSEDPMGLAMETAAEIAARSPEAVRAAKRLLNAANKTGTAEGLMAESVEQQALLGSFNQQEAVAANREGRPPAFRGAESY